MLHALASIFRWLVGWGCCWCCGWGCGGGVTVCLVSGRGGRAFLGVRVLSSGLWWTGGASCVSMELVGPGGVRVWRGGDQSRGGWFCSAGWCGGVVGGGSGDAYQLQVDCPGLPGAGGGGGQGEQLGEGRQVTGQGHDQAPGTVLREALQGEVVEPGVFCAADAVPWRRVRSWWRTLRSAS